MPKVFITQETTNIDYTPAVQFGDLVFVSGIHDRLSPHPNSLNNANIMKRVCSALDQFEPDDYLVCSGSPAMMAIVGNLLGEKLHNVLIWDNRESKYFNLELEKII